MNKTDLAYIAGFFDGEGCICLGKDGKHIYLQVSASQTNEWIINWLRLSFGGGVSKKARKGRERQGWQWIVRGGKACMFLVEILPFLKLKRAEAELALQFQGRRKGRGYRPTDKERAVDEAQRIMMSNLKK